MATGRWVRLVIEGRAKQASVWEGEYFQTGISLTGNDSGGLLGRNAIKEVCPTFDATVESGFETDAQFNMDIAWRGSQANAAFGKDNLKSYAVAAVAMATANVAMLSSTYEITGVKISAFDALGKVINGGNTYVLKTPVAGTGVIGLPPQCACVLSLRTGARGPGGRGRMYWPFLAGAATGALVDAAKATTLRTSFKTFADACWTHGACTAVVNKAGLTYSGITAVSTGDHIDTQRRRAQEVRETYASTTIGA